MHKQKLISILGGGFSLLIPELLEKAVVPYQRRGATKKLHKVSVLEGCYSAAAILLACLMIESYRMRVVYFWRRRNVDRRKEIEKSVAQTLTDCLVEKEPKFPKVAFCTVLNEIFVLRDVIAHNHLYEIFERYDSDWNLRNVRHRRLLGFFDRARFRSHVNLSNRKTKILKCNVQPLRIGYEDALKVLIVCDTLIGVFERSYGRGLMPLILNYKAGNTWTQSLGELISLLFEKLTAKDRYRVAKEVLLPLSVRFSTYLPNAGDWFLKNQCPGCNFFGFRRFNRDIRCYKCNFSVKFVSLR